MAKLPDFFGLDFGNHSIKIVQLKDVAHKPTLVNFGSAPTPFAALTSDSDDSKKKIADCAKALVKELKLNTNKVVSALPETSVFSRLVKLPRELPPDKLDEAIYWQAKQDLPVPVDEVQIDYTITGESFAQDGSKQWDILRVAAPKMLIEHYIDIIKMADLVPLAMETEAIALVRAMSYLQDDDSTVLFDFGSNNVEIAIMKKGFLEFSQTIAIGSDILTKAIAQDFGLETAQAEEYKRSYGLDSTQLEGKIAKTLMPVIDSVVSELRRAIDYFTSSSPENIPNKIVLLGEGSSLPGFVEYLAENMHLEVQLGNPWVKVNIPKDDSAAQPTMQFTQGYAVSVGLALKNN